jgi:hypothetical protein
MQVQVEESRELLRGTLGEGTLSIEKVKIVSRRGRAKQQDPDNPSDIC